MSISTHSLCVNLGTKEVLQQVNVHIEQGSSVAIIGPNGCGKSTLLRALCGVLKPNSGFVQVDGANLQAQSKLSLAKKIGLLSQSSSVPPMLSVREHVSLGRHPHRSYRSRNPVLDRLVVQDAISTCRLDDLSDRPIEQLSGGERQRVRIATLLAQQTDILLLDEPMNGLDIEHQYDLLALISKLQQFDNKTVIAVLHDLSMAMTHFEQIIIMDNGVIVSDGPPQSTINTEIISSVFQVNATISYDNHMTKPFVTYEPKSSLPNYSKNQETTA